MNMRLTRFTDYSLRVLIYLGTYQEKNATVEEISRYYHLSKNHLMKIVHHLSKGGYIITTRGHRGGMRLARPPELINLGEMIFNTEENLNIVECFQISKQECTLLPGCGLQSILNKALYDFLKTLTRYTLLDILPSQHKKSPGSMNQDPYDFKKLFEHLPAFK